MSDKPDTITWSEIQAKRLKELAAKESDVLARFGSMTGRNQAFQELERKLVKERRQELNEFRQSQEQPALCHLETVLVQTLLKAGFVQVTTPILMSKGLLAKMSITPTHPLYSQVFWADRQRCLRPMLAPHLYYVLKDLLRLWEKPVRIFEVGPCFRKESQGAQHAAEFTMLNLVEMGLPLEDRQQRLEELAALVCQAAGIKDFSLGKETSVVYGETIDVLAPGPASSPVEPGQVQAGQVTGGNSREMIEIGSAAMGPHPLDQAWKITDTWVGIGFGLERLLMVREQGDSLAHYGRSLAYLNGIRLNI